MEKFLKFIIFLLIILMFMIVIHTNVRAADEWTKTDIGLQVVSTGLQFIDWGMTLDIADKPDRYSEINPILGEHPSRGRVNTYFTVSVLSNILIAHVLPSPYRKAWLGSRIAVSAYLVDRGCGIGLRVNF